LSVNKDMVALVKGVRDGLAEPVEGHDAVPLGFGLPLVARVLPRHLEDLTFELLQKVQQRRQKKSGTLYLAAVSKVLAHRKIISAPVMRMQRPRHPNPHLLTGVPEKWVQAAKYWRENARYSARVRQATYYLLLTVGRWLAAKHPTITTPEQWDRNLAVECLTMITNMRCGDFRAQWVGVGKASVGWVERHARRLCELAKPEREDTHLLPD
jgi:hypothetical protein